ncbi:MAG: helix-turn-helix domain-containing protein [Planctomycetota bacterium]
MIRKTDPCPPNAARNKNHSCIERNGRVTHVIVPVDEYEDLVKASMVDSAIAKLEDKKSKWIDADRLGLELAGQRIAQARKAKGWTQIQLGKKLKLPQSQISRIERNPDHTTIRTLKKIAKALGVDVSALV